MGKVTFHRQRGALASGVFSRSDVEHRASSIWRRTRRHHCIITYHGGQAADTTSAAIDLVQLQVNSLQSLYQFITSFE